MRAVAALVLLGVLEAWPGVADDTRPKALREVGFDQRLGEAVPLDASFRDESGRAVKLGDYFKQRPVILSLAYYECPMLCTLTLNGLVSALSVLSFQPGQDFEIVTVSFEPKETAALAAAKKKSYLARYKRPGAEQGWHFLTGDEESIRRLTQAVGFRYVWDTATRQYAHATGVIVATPEGKLSHYLYGIEYAPKDLRLAIVDASAGKVGSPIDAALLFCYHYDPATGKYSLAFMNILRAAGLATMAALFGFVFVMHRRERAASARVPAERLS